MRRRYHPSLPLQWVRFLFFLFTCPTLPLIPTQTVNATKTRWYWIWMDREIFPSRWAMMSYVFQTRRQHIILGAFDMRRWFLRHILDETVSVPSLVVSSHKPYVQAKRSTRSGYQLSYELDELHKDFRPRTGFRSCTMLVCVESAGTDGSSLTSINSSLGGRWGQTWESEEFATDRKLINWQGGSDRKLARPIPGILKATGMPPVIQNGIATCQEPFKA